MFREWPPLMFVVRNVSIANNQGLENETDPGKLVQSTDDDRYYLNF